MLLQNEKSLLDDLGQGQTLYSAQSCVTFGPRRIPNSRRRTKIECIQINASASSNRIEIAELIKVVRRPQEQFWISSITSTRSAHSKSDTVRIAKGDRQCKVSIYRCTMKWWQNSYSIRCENRAPNASSTIEIRCGICCETSGHFAATEGTKNEAQYFSRASNGYNSIV